VGVRGAHRPRHSGPLRWLEEMDEIGIPIRGEHTDAAIMATRAECVMLNTRPVRMWGDAITRCAGFVRRMIEHQSEAKLPLRALSSW